MKRMLTLLMCMLCCMLCAAALGEDADLIGGVQALRDELAGEQKVEWSLNMGAPMATVEMKADAFDAKDEAFLRQLGFGEDYIGDITSMGSSRWSDTDSDGQTITVVFCGAYGETAFVFQRDTDGSEYLLDVLLGTNDNVVSAEIVELSGARYLLTNGYGHGTGTYRGWTNWYNLDMRRMELRTLREGYENLYQVFAEAVTTTNIDDALELSGMDKPEHLITYTYTSVCEYDNSGKQRRTLLDSDCTVRVYRSTRDGLRLMGERVFDTVAPGVLEQADADELLNANWMLMQEGEEMLETAQIQEKTEWTQDAALAGVLRASLPSATVVHADWVNLRSEGDKASAPLGAIDAGDTVYILAERQGTENGWTKVLWMPEGAGARVGYIWWSFLEKSE